MNIVIVGGGTAGWVSALYIQRLYPSFSITVVESEQIGILGAGEGTTPHFISFIDFVGIPFSDLVANCSATIKVGIKFSRWRDDGGSYFHPFSEREIVRGSDSPECSDCTKNVKNIGVINDDMIDIYGGESINELISDSECAPFIPWANHDYSYKQNKIDEFISVCDWAAHFDARKLAKHFSSFAISRGVKRVEGIIEKIEFAKNGDVSQVSTGDTSLPCDLVIDATGFARVFTGATFGSPWVDCSDRLPANMALPFFTETDEEIPPYTESIAMSSGWMWKIPVLNRYGCGYVTSSDYISEEKASSEISEFLGFTPEFGKTFKFSAGYHKSIWNKNCLAVGLSAGFVEPLEATSIWQTLLILERFFGDRRNLFTPNEHMRFVFNKRFTEDTEQVVDFLFMHYRNSRADTPFWNSFHEERQGSEFVKYLYDIAKYRHIIQSDLPTNSLFSPESYMHIIYGTEMANKELISAEASRLNMYDVQKIKNRSDNRKKLSSLCVSHREFLDFISQT